MDIEKKKSYQIVINLTDEEVRELDRQNKSTDREVDYEEWYNSLYIIKFCEKIIKEITGMIG